MVESEVTYIEFLTQFYRKKNTDDVPSSARHPKNAHSVSPILDLSPNMAEKALKVPEFEQNMLNTDLMNNAVATHNRFKLRHSFSD